MGGLAVVLEKFTRVLVKNTRLPQVTRVKAHSNIASICPQLQVVEK